MNIFVLDPRPDIAARQHCDKHVVKMIVEYAQLLSTAHRVLDGTETSITLNNSLGKLRTRKILLLDGEELCFTVERRDDGGWQQKPVIENRRAYNATHANHPSNVWARTTHANYEWLHELWVSLMAEYTRRYGKRHAAMGYLTQLSTLPTNIPVGPLTEFPQAMPPHLQVPNDPVAAYRRFYVAVKSRFAKWTDTDVPEWFKQGLKEEYDASRFERTRRVV